MQTDMNAASTMPGSVQNSFRQTQNFSTSYVQHGFLNQSPSAMTFPTSVMNQVPPSQIPITPAFNYPFPIPGRAANPSPTGNNSLGSFGSIGDESMLQLCTDAAASTNDGTASSSPGKCRKKEGLTPTFPKAAIVGRFDVDSWPLMEQFIKLVNSKFFESAIAKARHGGRKASLIGGAVKEAELFSHPDALLAMHHEYGSLKEVPINFSDIFHGKKVCAGLKNWKRADTELLFLQFAEKWLELYPMWEIVSMLLLYGDGRIKSAQDIHIDIGRGGGQFIFSVSDRRVGCTVTYEDKTHCFGRGSLYHCLDFLGDWGVSIADVKTIKDSLADFFDDVDAGNADDGWKLIDSDHGALLHDFGSARENRGSLEPGGYVFQQEPVAHRAPTVDVQVNEKGSRNNAQSTGVARPVIFGVVRPRHTDYTYNYNDQKTPPQLLGQIIETLFPRLQLPSDFKAKDDYPKSGHYSAKASLLFVFAKTITRSVPTSCL